MKSASENNANNGGFDNNIEQRLEQLGRQWPGESIAERVMARIESEGICPGPAPKRQRGRGVLALAASLLVIAGGWWIWQQIDRPLYARVLSAMEEARSLHKMTRVVAAEGGDGKPAIEAWAERGVGFRIENPDEIRLGNRKHFWTYSKKRSLAVRSASTALEEMLSAELDLRQAIKLWMDFGVERDPSEDTRIDGRPAEAYALTKTDTFVDAELKTGKRRTVLLLDDKLRLVRVLDQPRVGDRWVTRAFTDWSYDVTIDPKLFEPDFGAGVKIVDADEAFDAFVDLKKALHSEERSGLIYAIHRAERFAGGILVISSVRGSAATLKEYPVEWRPLRIGLMYPAGPAKNYQASPQGSNFFRIDLASADHGGIDVSWWAVVPRGVPITAFDVAPGKVKLPVGITPQGKFAKAKFADEQGVVHHLNWDVTLDLSSIDPPPTLDSVAQSVFSDMTVLASLPFRWLNLGAKPGTNTSNIVDPEQASVVEYAAAVEQHVKLWYERDVEFQLRGQFEFERPAWSRGEAWPAMGFQYNPLVDDATLAEVAKRADLARLYLAGTRVTDAGLAQLTGLQKLEDLSLKQTTVGDAATATLRTLPSLRKLNVEQTKFTDTGVAELTNSLPKLKVEK